MKWIQKYIIFIVVVLIFILLNFINSRFIPKIDENIICSDYKNIKEKELSELYDILKITNENNNYLITKLKYRDIYDFKNEFIIYKGKKSNLKEGLPVLNDHGLIGTIKQVNKNSSKVQLITNKKSAISVKINDTYGILKYVNNELIVSNITNLEQINTGDLVYTSGLGKLPGDILVGEVSSVKTDNLGIEKKLYIDSAVNFNKINYLIVAGVK